MREDGETRKGQECPRKGHSCRRTASPPPNPVPSGYGLIVTVVVAHLLVSRSLRGDDIHPQVPRAVTGDQPDRGGERD